jgi:putative tricarboxylic transport membrane protein
MAEFMNGLGNLAGDPFAILLFFAALITGLFFAAMPGVNMVTLGAIILPFTVYLDATHAAENAPTAFDGYPLTQKGQSGKAIGAAIMSSSMGGIFSAIVMMIAAPTVARWAIHAFGPPEIFSLIFFGLTVCSPP